MSAPASELDSDLRDDIRRLGAQLGDTLVRQAGPELLERVERVRQHARQLRRDDDTSAALADVLGNVDLVEAIQLVRAFTTYFHLANTAEQVHRIDHLTETKAARTNRFDQTVQRLLESGFSSEDVVAAVHNAQLYPDRKSVV